MGGIDTRDLDSKTMAVKAVPGLYFIGEVVDVTGWLGGYNFQWAWSSGWCAGQSGHPLRSTAWPPNWARSAAFTFAAKSPLDCES